MTYIKGYSFPVQRRRISFPFNIDGLLKFYHKLRGKSTAESNILLDIRPRPDYSFSESKQTDNKNRQGIRKLFLSCRHSIRALSFLFWTRITQRSLGNFNQGLRRKKQTEPQGIGGITNVLLYQGIWPSKQSINSVFDTHSGILPRLS